MGGSFNVLLSVLYFLISINIQNWDPLVVDILFIGHLWHVLIRNITETIKELGRFLFPFFFSLASQGGHAELNFSRYFSMEIIVVLFTGRRRKYMQNTKNFLASRLCFILISNQRSYGYNSGAKSCISSA